MDADTTILPSPSQLLNTLLHNILDHPEEVKYRSFKAENARISRDVLAVPGGQDFLVQAGFGRRTVAFKAEWYVAPPGSLSDWGWRKLELASKVLQDRVGESEWRADMERDRKSREEDEEKNRVKRALLEAEEDRQRVADRVQRERRVRAAEAAAALSSSASNSTETPQSATDIEHDGPSVSSETLTATATGSAIGPDDYTREVPFDEPSVRPGEAEDAEEDEDGERPPPYGQAEWGTGRRLGSSS